LDGAGASAAASVAAGAGSLAVVAGAFVVAGGAAGAGATVEQAAESALDTPSSRNRVINSEQKECGIVRSF
jgi:hypothetical protein